MLLVLIHLQGNPKQSSTHLKTVEFSGFRRAELFLGLPSWAFLPESSSSALLIDCRDLCMQPFIVAACGTDVIQILRLPFIGS